jgi:hypothetical protein
LKERGELYSDIFEELKVDAVLIDVPSPVVQSLPKDHLDSNKITTGSVITRIYRGPFADAVGERWFSMTVMVCEWFFCCCYCC